MDDELRRCYYCKRLWMRGEVVTEGCCGECGSRKFTGVSRLTDQEMQSLVERGYKPGSEWEQYDSPLG